MDKRLYSQEERIFIKEFCDKLYWTYETKCEKLRPVFKKKFGRILDISSGNSLHKFISRMKWVPQTVSDMQADIHAVVQEDIKRHKQKKESVEDKKKNNQLIIEITRLQEEKDILLDIQESRYEPCIIKPDTKRKSEAVAVMVGSDWHAEEVVDPRTINGMNEYNPEIAQKRMQNFFKNGLKLTDMMAKEVTIDKIMLAMLWDFISGYIHQELVENNALSPTEAIVFVHQQICDGINYMLANSKYELVIVMKHGNHGRTTEKIRVSTGAKNSFEWMMYQFIAQQFKWNKRVKFIIDEGYMTYVDILGHTIRLMHGDAIQYGWWIGGITIPVKKAIGQWNKVKHADLTVFWHFHQSVSHKDFVCNGSLIGYNAYAERIKAEYEAPQQSFFLIDREHWKTIEAPIFL